MEKHFGRAAAVVFIAVVTVVAVVIVYTLSAGSFSICRTLKI